MKIMIEKVVSFYDEKEQLDSRHASAITGLTGEDIAAGLLKHYFDNCGNDCEILNAKPTEGTRKGKWLDRWIKVQKNGETTFYQTEIKNWCSHSLQGKQILLDATDDQIMQYSYQRFIEQWDDEHQTLRYDYVAKVLRPMQKRNLDSVGVVAPLICFWYPILNPTITTITPFFAATCKNENFNQLYFFSLSLYLRMLRRAGVQVIDITMPHFEERIRRLRDMYDFTFLLTS